MAAEMNMKGTETIVSSEGRRVVVKRLGAMGVTRVIDILKERLEDESVQHSIKALKQMAFSGGDSTTGDEAGGGNAEAIIIQLEGVLSMISVETLTALAEVIEICTDLDATVITEDDDLDEAEIAEILVAAFRVNDFGARMSRLGNALAPLRDSAAEGQASAGVSSSNGVAPVEQPVSPSSSSTSSGELMVGAPA